MRMTLAMSLLDVLARIEAPILEAGPRPVNTCFPVFVDAPAAYRAYAQFSGYAVGNSGVADRAAPHLVPVERGAIANARSDDPLGCVLGRMPFEHMFLRT